MNNYRRERKVYLCEDTQTIGCKVLHPPPTHSSGCPIPRPQALRHQQRTPLITRFHASVANPPLKSCSSLVGTAP